MVVPKIWCFNCAPERIDKILTQRFSNSFSLAIHPRFWRIDISMCITASDSFVYAHEVETCLVSAHLTPVSTDTHLNFDPRLAVSEVRISMQSDCLACITVYESKVMIIVAFHHCWDGFCLACQPNFVRFLKFSDRSSLRVSWPFIKFMTKKANFITSKMILRGDWYFAQLFVSEEILYLNGDKKKCLLVWVYACFSCFLCQSKPEVGTRSFLFSTVRFYKVTVCFGFRLLPCLQHLLGYDLEVKLK